MVSLGMPEDPTAPGCYERLFIATHTESALDQISRFIADNPRRQQKEILCDGDSNTTGLVYDLFPNDILTEAPPVGTMTEEIRKGMLFAPRPLV